MVAGVFTIALLDRARFAHTGVVVREFLQTILRSDILCGYDTGFLFADLLQLPNSALASGFPVAK